MTVILALVAWLVTYLLHSTVLLVGAAALAASGLVRSHAGRDTLWKVALVGGILTATAQLALRLEPPTGHVAIAARPSSALLDVTSVRPAAAPPAPMAVPPASGVSSWPAPVVGAERPPRTERSLVEGLNVSWPAMLLNVWFLGALAFGAQLVWLRLSLARRLAGRSGVVDGPLADALAGLCLSSGVRIPKLSISDKLAGPIAFGREICLPQRVSSSLSPAEQRAVLAHELGHVVRRDPAWLVAAAMIETLLFIQPLNRLARRRLRAEAEFLCDDWAAERTGGVTLARCLAEVAGWVQGQAAPAAVAGMAGQCSQLVSRVERLLQGGTGTRPTRWIVRAGAGVTALALVACTIPGVAAEDITSTPRMSGRAESPPEPPDVAPVVLTSSYQGDGWGLVRDGRVIDLAAGYAVRITGHGRLGFNQWGRSIVVPDGYTISVAGHAIADDYELCDSAASVRISADDGDGAWDLVPVRIGGTAVESSAARTRVARSRGMDADTAVRDAEWALARADGDADAATDASLDGEGDAAIDTLVQLWLRDPDAVRRAARRIARTYDRDLRPQFESLGVQLGHEMAPQLERLTSRAGRDLGPEFARLGAALGASILSDLSADLNAPGSGDYQLKGKPKIR